MLAAKIYTTIWGKDRQFWWFDEKTIINIQFGIITFCLFYFPFWEFLRHGIKFSIWIFWGVCIWSREFLGFKEDPRAFLVLIFAPFYHPLTSTLEYPMGIKDMVGGGGGGGLFKPNYTFPKTVFCCLWLWRLYICFDVGYNVRYYCITI